MARARSKRRAPRRGIFGRIASGAIRAVLLFILISVVWVLIYRVVPPPFTFTMLGDLVSGRSVTKDWMPLSRIEGPRDEKTATSSDSVVGTDVSAGSSVTVAFVFVFR